MIDTRLSAKAARITTPKPPRVSLSDATAVVGELYSIAKAAMPIIEDVAGAPMAGKARVRVVERSAWSAQAIASYGTLLGDTLNNAVPEAPARSAVASLELGSLVGWMSGKVMGQFDPFSEPPALLLIAPNIVDVERELDVDATDFRWWVCLHEQTHQWQFDQAPWLKQWMVDQLEIISAQSLNTEGLSAIAEKVRKNGTRVGKAGGHGFAELSLTPQARHTLLEVSAALALIEGHADVMMDIGGEGVITTLPHLRRKMTKRRERPSPISKVVRRLLGMEAKLAQYKDGAAFVRTVLDRGGVRALNVAWQEPAMLPTAAELHEPTAWLRRALAS